MVLCLCALVAHSYRLWVRLILGICLCWDSMLKLDLKRPICEVFCWLAYLNLIVISSFGYKLQIYVGIEFHWCLIRLSISRFLTFWRVCS